MTMHLNAYGLSQQGFRLIASYQCITKGKRMLNIDCYTNDKEYLVRHFESGKRAWDHIYDNKDDANAKVKQLFSLYSFHKRIF